MKELSHGSLSQLHQDIKGLLHVAWLQLHQSPEGLLHEVAITQWEILVKISYPLGMLQTGRLSGSFVRPSLPSLFKAVTSHQRHKLGPGDLSGQSSSLQARSTLMGCSCMQVLLVSNFSNFPEKHVTVEFWMRSVDSCNGGVPFSYATGDFEQGDVNSFLISNYNNW